jgi:hypothetical protein
MTIYVPQQLLSLFPKCNVLILMTGSEWSSFFEVIMALLTDDNKKSKERKNHRQIPINHGFNPF